jgi:hypothetical protein
MATILPFLTDQPAFNPDDIAAMSIALDDVCSSLGIGADKIAKEVVAIRIIELARRGERSATKLRDHVLADANGGTG